MLTYFFYLFKNIFGGITFYLVCLPIVLVEFCWIKVFITILCDKYVTESIPVPVIIAVWEVWTWMGDYFNLYKSQVYCIFNELCLFLGLKINKKYYLGPLCSIRLVIRLLNIIVSPFDVLIGLIAYAVDYQHHNVWPIPIDNGLG